MAQPELTESIELELVLSVFSVVVDDVVASSHFPSLQMNPSLQTFTSVVPSLQKHFSVTG